MYSTPPVPLRPRSNLAGAVRRGHRLWYHPSVLPAVLPPYPRHPSRPDNSRWPGLNYRRAAHHPGFLGQLILSSLQTGQLLERVARVGFLFKSASEGFDPGLVRNILRLWQPEEIHPCSTDRNRSEALSSLLHCPKVAYSSN